MGRLPKNKDKELKEGDRVVISGYAENMNGIIGDLIEMSKYGSSNVKVSFVNKATSKDETAWMPSRYLEYVEEEK